MSKKTDNGHLNLKISLRKLFLEKYHTGKFSVLDCCEGSRQIWKRILPGREVQYVPLDVKPERGRVKMDSKRFLSMPGWDFDVIDIDTYGLPWKHYIEAIQHAPHSFTCFLTVGSLTMGGSMLSMPIKKFLRIEGLEPPLAICASLNKDFTVELISEACRFGFRIVEMKEAVPNDSGTARYFGVRLDKC